MCWGGSSQVLGLAKGSFPWGRPRKWAGGVFERQPLPPAQTGQVQ